MMGLRRRVGAAKAVHPAVVAAVATDAQAAPLLAGADIAGFLHGAGFGGRLGPGRVGRDADRVEAGVGVAAGGWTAAEAELAEAFGDDGVKDGLEVVEEDGVGGAFEDECELQTDLAETLQATMRYK